MAKVIMIMGESGSGKTTSMRELDPKTTVYFDCDKKGLSWKSWRDNFNAKNKNYFNTSDIDFIEKALQNIDGKTENAYVKTIAIDTINGIMIDDEMKRSKEKGYDKWTDLAVSVYGLIDKCHKLRNDLTVIFTGHTQVERDDNGYMFTRLKTSGRKLDKIVLESKFTTVLIAKCVDNRYLFETQSRNSTAKSPMGAFDSFEIENNVISVLNALKEY